MKLATRSAVMWLLWLFCAGTQGERQRILMMHILILSFHILWCRNLIEFHSKQLSLCARISKLIQQSFFGNFLIWLKHWLHRHCDRDATVSRLISLRLNGDQWDHCNNFMSIFGISDWLETDQKVIASQSHCLCDRGLNKTTKICY